MTKRIIASEQGLEPHWKVRVSILGGLLHLASLTEPVVYASQGEIVEVQAKWIDDHEYGDTVGFITWAAVTAITWRFSP